LVLVGLFDSLFSREIDESLADILRWRKVLAFSLSLDGSLETIRQSDGDFLVCLVHVSIVRHVRQIASDIFNLSDFDTWTRDAEKKMKESEK